MCDSLSKLYSSIYNSLGQPDDSILSRIELATIVFRRLSFRLEGVRQAEQSISIAKSADITFANNENEYDLTENIADFVVPMWAEFKSYNIQNNPVWIFLPTVNLPMLAEQRNLGRYACSFYGDTARQVKIQLSMYGNETNSPFNRVRVWYLPTIPFPTNEQETIDLPDNLVNMVVYDALVSAIPIMITNATKQLGDVPSYKDQIGAWQGLYAHYERERAEFLEYYEKWRRESRGSHRPRMQTDVLTQVIGNRGAMYPFFSNNNGR